MRKQIEDSPVPFTALEPGEVLERGGEVGPEQNGIDLGGGIEIVDTPENLAAFGRKLVVTFGHNPPPCTDPQVLLVGRISSGFSAYGPYPASDDEGDGEAYDRIRAIEEVGEADYAVLPIQPLTELGTLHGNDPMPKLVLGRPGAVKAAGFVPVEVAGCGTLTEKTNIFYQVVGGRKVAAYAIIGRELVETVDWTEDGEPDWDGASICDPYRGDEGFFHPAWALLRFWNSETVGETSWSKGDHDDLTNALRAYNVESWTYDGSQGAYRLSDGVDDEFVIRTPADARAYVAGLRAAAR